jgi:hypothetical protein
VTLRFRWAQRRDELSARLDAFAVAGMAVAVALQRSVAGRHMSRQLVRCSTSPGANYEEVEFTQASHGLVHDPGSWGILRVKVPAGTNQVVVAP